jgi:hypothetical protein
MVRHGRSRSSSAAMVRRLCVIVFRNRPRRSGTITRIGPWALVSIDSRRRVAAPRCSGTSSVRWWSRNGPKRTSHAARRSGSYFDDGGGSLHATTSLPTHDAGGGTDTYRPRGCLAHLKQIGVPPGVVLEVVPRDEVEHDPGRARHNPLDGHDGHGTPPRGLGRTLFSVPRTRVKPSAPPCASRSARTCATLALHATRHSRRPRKSPPPAVVHCGCRAQCSLRLHAAAPSGSLRALRRREMVRVIQSEEGAHAEVPHRGLVHP